MPLEAALLQDMKHDCIVNLLKHKFVTAQQERQLWLVMEFCDKGPLDVRHPRPSPVLDHTLLCLAVLMICAKGPLSNGFWPAFIPFQR